MKNKVWGCTLIVVALCISVGAQVPVIASYLHWAGTAPLTTQGGFLDWNREVAGETDFENVPGSGPGGFCWWNTTVPTKLACLDSTGVLTASGFVGPLTGNASSATTATSAGSATTAATAGALAAAPTPCATGKYAGGVDVHGNSTGCSPLWLMASTSTVTATGSGAASTGSASITWTGSGFSGGTYFTVCSGTNPTGSPQQISVVSQTGSTVGVQFQNGTASQAIVSTYGTITCLGQQ